VHLKSDVERNEKKPMHIHNDFAPDAAERAYAEQMLGVTDMDTDFLKLMGLAEHAWQRPTMEQGVEALKRLERINKAKKLRQAWLAQRQAKLETVQSMTTKSETETAVVVVASADSSAVADCTVAAAVEQYGGVAPMQLDD
jgi:hypothetical protein